MSEMCSNQPLEEKIKELEVTLQAMQIENEDLKSKNHDLKVKFEDLEAKNVALNKTNPYDWATIEQAIKWAESHKFSVLSFNATLNTKMEPINDLVQDIKPTLVIVSEIGRPTWKIDDKCPPFLIKGYEGPYHSGKQINDKGKKKNIIEASHKQSNGVAIWVRKDVSCNEVTEDLKILGGSASKEMNYCVLKTDQLMVVGLYKSPTTNFKSFKKTFSDLVLRIQVPYAPKGVLIAGDINFNLDADDDVAAASYKEETTNVYYLIQHIQKPTRIGATKTSCLDHIMTNFKVDVADVLDHKFKDHQTTFAAWNEIVLPELIQGP